MENLTVNLAGKVTKAILNGRMHMVAPVRMIVTGVLNGSKGPLYYPPDEIHKDPDSWNHMPLTLGHPMQDGRPISARKPNVLNKYALGVLLNVKATKGILDGEAWFDVDRTMKLEPRIIESLRANKPIELSTGLFTDNVPAHNGANYRGRPYTFVARNYKPDHLAILVDTKGACSLKDGCGVLVNADQVNNSIGTALMATATLGGAILGGIGGMKRGYAKGLEKATPIALSAMNRWRTSKNVVDAAEFIAKRDPNVIHLSPRHGYEGLGELAKHFSSTADPEIVKMTRGGVATERSLVSTLAQMSGTNGPSAYISKSGKEVVFSADKMVPEVLGHELGHIIDQRKVGKIDVAKEYGPFGVLTGKQYKREVAAWAESGFPVDKEALETYRIAKSETRKGTVTGAVGGGLSGLGFGGAAVIGVEKVAAKSSGTQENCGTGAGGFKPGNTCATHNVNIVNNIIRKVGKKWRLYSHAGKNLGTFDSREAAIKHEQQVKYFKHTNNKENSILRSPSINCLKGLSYGQLKDQLQDRLSSLASTMEALSDDSDGVAFSVVDVYDDYVLFTDGKDDYVQEYVNDDGHVMLEGEPEAVDDETEFPDGVEIIQEEDAVSPTQNSWNDDLHPRDELGRFARVAGQEASRFGKFARYAEEHHTAAELHGQAYAAYQQAGMRSRKKKEQYAASAEQHYRLADLHYAAASTLASRKRNSKVVIPASRVAGKVVGTLVENPELGAVAGEAVGHAITALMQRKKIKHYG